MAASPRVLHRITAWWGCNQDRSLLFPLPFYLTHSRLSGFCPVAVTRAGRALQTCNQYASHPPSWDFGVAGSEAAAGFGVFISEIHCVRFRALVFVSARHELPFLRSRRVNAVEHFLSGKRWRR